VKKARAQHRSSDPQWWGLAILLSLAAVWLPALLNLQTSGNAWLVILGSALFFTGGIVGFACPRRPWRWALAGFLTFAVRDLAIRLSIPGAADASMAAAANQVAHNCPTYLMQALPILVGAYVSAWISNAGLD
jgi:hypothetical protein